MVDGQVEDQIEILELMMNDLEKESPLYRPTNYWSYYEKMFLPEIYQYGLNDFRRRRQSVLSSFGATDLSPMLFDIRKYRLISNSLLKKIHGWKSSVNFINQMSNSLLKHVPGLLYKKQLRSFEIAKKYSEFCGAQSIENINVSKIGNPEGVFLVNNRAYTENFLFYYLRYCYCHRFIDFKQIQTLVELGSGSGKQIEVICKLHPHISCLLFDIPPQLYVCQQYLKSVFPERVVPYEITREWSDIPSLQAGKIYILGSHKFPLIQSLKIDLFWNCASFQEMEPEVVGNYLKFVDMASEYVYLYEIMTGKNTARRQGEHGVLQSVTEKDYKNGLKSFKNIDFSKPITTNILNSDKGYVDSFWARFSGSI